MYKTASEIETEILETNQRLNELIQLQTKQQNEVINLQRGLTTGINSLSEVEAAKSRLTLLETAISSLKLDLTKLHKSLEDAVKAENRSVQLKKAKPIMLEIEQSYIDYLEYASELNEVLGELGNKMVSALYQFNNKHTELGNLLPNESIEIAAREIGLPKQTINTILEPRPNNVSLEFSSLIKLVEQEIVTRRKAFAKMRLDAQKREEMENYWTSPLYNPYPA